jgi:ATP-dependent helicase Lhr and Lhr-like helicase
LHHKVQRWVWAQRWPELRDAQEQAIPHVAPADRDVIIAAATASGKTEAAFLPICSTLLH